MLQNLHRLFAVPYLSDQQLKDVNSANISTGSESLPIIDYDQSDAPSSSSNSTDESIQDASQLVEDSARDYDLEMLANNPYYPEALKNRIRSSKGHLSNEASRNYIEALFKAGTKRFFLAHLSQENNSPEKALS